MDIHNMEIISYILFDQLNGITMLRDLEEAIERTNGCPYSRTFHSDRGRGYQMTACHVRRTPHLSKHDEKRQLLRQRTHGKLL